jgi:hypothetical protein
LQLLNSDPDAVMERNRVQTIEHQQTAHSLIRSELRQSLSAWFSIIRQQIHNPAKPRAMNIHQSLYKFGGVISDVRIGAFVESLEQKLDLLDLFSCALVVHELSSKTVFLKVARASRL